MLQSKIDDIISILRLIVALNKSKQIREETTNQKQENKMNETVLQRIIAHIFGHKYYANIVLRKGTTERVISNYIFHSREEAEQHRKTFETNLSFIFVETVSFRSHHEY